VGYDGYISNFHNRDLLFCDKVFVVAPTSFKVTYNYEKPVR
jgi:hypothetical protein